MKEKRESKFWRIPSNIFGRIPFTSREWIFFELPDTPCMLLSTILKALFSFSLSPTHPPAKNKKREMFYAIQL